MSGLLTGGGDLRGLTSEEAARRLAEHGPNELPRPEARSVVRIVADVLAEPMLALLLVGGGIYLILGSLGEAMILLAFACLSIVITVVQESRTERVLESLRDLASPRALVIRDGERRRIAGREVVVGDLLVVGEGDRVAADAVIRQCHDLEADESLLTGEAVPVRKRPTVEDRPAVARPGGDDLPFVFSGAMIVRGTGIGEVIAIGEDSEMGRIGRTLASVASDTPRLTVETGRMIRVFAFLGLGVSALVLLLYGLTRGDWLDAVLAGIAIGMSMMPEEFPVVLAVFMAMGAWRISKARVLTRRANAIEALGSITVLCTDKTGTLTENRMTIAELWPVGAAEAWRAGADAGARPGPARELVRVGCLASEADPYDPMERAFLRAAGDDGLIFGAAEGWRLVRTYPLTRELLAVTHIWERPETGELFVACKGAPEAVDRLCGLDDVASGALRLQVERMAGEGQRVLAVAWARHVGEPLPSDPTAFDFSPLGLVGLADPLRASVPAAIAECRSAGIRVAMITGDYPSTALAIARGAGIEATAAMSGDQLASLNDDALDGRMTDADVFARIMPEQKLRIVTALKRHGEVVAMTGDGVNDAPSLKAADVGVAMGDRGTDVAREASSIVLLDNDFSSIVAAIRLGRRIYDNLGKAMGFIMAVHIPIAGLAIMPLVFGTPLLFGPVHIAFLEMVIDPVCSLVFEAEREEADVMRRPPRAPDAHLFSGRAVTLALIEGVAGLIAVAALYLGTLSAGYPDDDVRAMTFVSLILVIVVLIMVNRSFGTSLLSAVMRPNRTLIGVLAVILPILAIVLFWPPVRSLFGFGLLHADDLALALAVSLLVMIGLQGAKLVLARRAGGLR